MLHASAGNNSQKKPLNITASEGLAFLNARFGLLNPSATTNDNDDVDMNNDHDDDNEFNQQEDLIMVEKEVNVTQEQDSDDDKQEDPDYEDESDKECDPLPAVNESQRHIQVIDNENNNNNNNNPTCLTIDVIKQLGLNEKDMITYFFHMKKSIEQDTKTIENVQSVCQDARTKLELTNKLMAEYGNNKLLLRVRNTNQKKKDRAKVKLKNAIARKVKNEKDLSIFLKPNMDSVLNNVKESFSKVI